MKKAYPPIFAIRRLLTLSLSLLAALTATGQVVGTVTDATTGEALLAATVLVEGTAIGEVTDFDGKYRLTNLDAGEQVLVFSYIGYESETVTIDFVPGVRQTFDVDLAPAGFTTETVTVTGQRMGQDAAINQQVKSDQLVNVVSAERIRELPDENAAESVGRLPGVGVSRSGGEGQRVNIRGLSPKFSSVNLDGVRIPATGQGRQVFNIRTGGGGNSVSPSVDDRSVDLSMISSEALAGIEVYKSLTPDQDGDAIGGSVNFISAKAPQREKILANALVGTNLYHESYDNVKANVVYSRRFFNSNFGLIATGAFSQIDRSSDASDVSYIFQDTTVLDRINLNDSQTDRRRYNGSLALDYDLGQGHELFFNGSYARTTVENEFRGTTLIVRTNAADVYAGTNESNIDLVNASLTGRHPIANALFDWKATFIQTTDESPAGYNYGFRDLNPFSGVQIPEQDPFQAVSLFRWDPENLGGGFPGGGFVSERLDANFVGQLNLRHDVRIQAINTAGFLKFGAKTRIKERTRRQTAGNIFNGNFGAAYAAEFPERPFVRQLTPGIAPFLEPDVDLTGFFDGTFPMLLSIDPSQAQILFNQFDEGRYDLINPGTNDYDANERIYAGYAMANLKFGQRITMVGGLRYEYSDNDYTANLLDNYGERVENGQVVLNGIIEERTSEQTYGELLPMLNLKINLYENADNSNGLDLRLAATRALTRPDYYNLTPYVNINDSGFSIERSEPNLLPTTAWNYDAFLTLFTNRFGLISIGGFYKELDNIDFLYGRRVLTDQIVERFGDEFGLDAPFTVVEPINAPATTFVRGAELEIQTSLKWLPSPFDGVVLYGNYSRINSSTKYPQRYAFFDFETFESTFIDSTRDGTLPGQSRDIANASVGYDKGGFSGRISWNFQGKSIGFIGANEQLDNYTDDYLRIDASAKYQFTDKLSIQVNINNLNNRYDRSVVGVNNRIGAQSIFGTMAWLGLRYSGFLGRETL